MNFIDSVNALVETMRSGASADDILKRSAWLASHLPKEEREDLLARIMREDAGRLVRAATVVAEAEAVARAKPRQVSAFSESERERQERAARYAQEDADRPTLAGIVGDALRRFESELRMSWTRELLESTFAVGDGTFVTWGNATIEQHRERAAMFVSNAEANLMGAARHQQAVADLEGGGAKCLNELTSVRLPS